MKLKVGRKLKALLYTALTVNIVGLFLSLLSFLPAWVSAVTAIVVIIVGIYLIFYINIDGPDS